MKFAKQYIKGKLLAKNSGLSEVAVAAFSGAGVYELASGNCLKNVNLNLQFHRKVGNFLDVTLFLCNSSLPKRQQ